MRSIFLFFTFVLICLFVNNIYAKRNKTKKPKADDSSNNKADKILQATDQLLKAELPSFIDVPAVIEPKNNSTEYTNKSEHSTTSGHTSKLEIATTHLPKTTKNNDIITTDLPNSKHNYITTTDLPKTTKKKKKKKKTTTVDSESTTTPNSVSNETELTLVCHFEPSNKKESFPPNSVVFVPNSEPLSRTKKKKQKTTIAPNFTNHTTTTTTHYSTTKAKLKAKELKDSTDAVLLKEGQSENITDHNNRTSEANNRTTNGNNIKIEANVVTGNETSGDLFLKFSLLHNELTSYSGSNNNTAEGNGTDTNSTDQDKKLKDSYYHYEYEYESESYSSKGSKGKNKGGLGGLGGGGGGFGGLGNSLGEITKPKKKPKKKKKSPKSSGSSSSSYEESYESQETITKSKNKPKKKTKAESEDMEEEEVTPKPKKAKSESKSSVEEEVVEYEEVTTKPKKKSKTVSKSSETVYYEEVKTSSKKSSGKSGSGSSSSSSSSKSSAESPEEEVVIEEKPKPKKSSKTSTEAVEYEDDTTTQKPKKTTKIISTKASADDDEDGEVYSTEWTYGSTEWVVTSKPKKAKREVQFDTDFEYDINNLIAKQPLDNESANKKFINDIRVESDLSNQCKEIIRDKRSPKDGAMKSYSLLGGLTKLKDVFSNASEVLKPEKKPIKTYDMKKYGELNKMVMEAYKDTFEKIMERYRSDPSFSNSYNETALNRKPLWIDMYNSNPVLKYIPGRTCFRELGCFIAENFYENTPRAFSLLPETPNAMSIKFMLFTPKNPTNGYELTYNSADDDIKKSPFNEHMRTVFIVHGFWDSYEGSDAWQIKIRNNFLDVSAGNSSNVIIIDWSKGAKVVLYPLALTNSRIVGAEIAFFIKRIADLYKINYYDKVHCIGHNLGAHSCGWLGKRVEKKIGRITGLDPSGPLFYQTQDRLGPEDALLVDIIHTDWGDNHKEGYGIKDNIGHFDFYPNGGHHQPNCKPTTGVKPVVRDIVTGIFLSCSHTRANELFHVFNDRHSKCQPIGYECPDFYYFIEGRCAHCGMFNDKCKLMGHWPEYWAVTTIMTPKKFYLKTGDKTCLFHYQIALHIDANSLTENNNIDLKFIINAEQKKTTITKSAHFFEPESIYVFLYVSETRIGLASDMLFEWTSGANVNSNDTLGINCIEINHMSHSNKKIRDKNTSLLCPKSNQIKAGIPATFEKCNTLSEPIKLARYSSPFDLKAM